MPDEQTDTTPQEAVEAPEQAEAEAPAPGTAEAPEQTPPAEEEINIDEYWQNRYPAVASSDNRSAVEEVARELANLPTDETGTVDANAAAEWFASKLSQVEQRAINSATQAAERASMSVLSETAQQRQLIEKHPELTRDKEQLDAVFDLRDAAMLRGESLSLMQAAEKLNKLRGKYKEEAVKDATRSTQIQAAAHLETSSVKGNEDVSERQRLALSAFTGVGSEAKQARQELLKRYVQGEIKEGRIQHP